jgi:hypothetical protein
VLAKLATPSRTEENMKIIELDEGDMQPLNKDIHTEKVLERFLSSIWR